MPPNHDASGERPSRRARVRQQSRPAASFTITTVRGIPIYIGASWLIITLVLVVLLGPQIGRLVPGIGWGAYAAALLYALLLLASVLIHELAHALTALRYGYRVDRIVADLFGGHTVYQTPDTRPGRQAMVAFVGPAANGVVALVGALAGMLATEPLLWVLIGAVTWTNAFVAVFNLLPGLPLDGGHVVAALGWKVSGRRSVGLRLAGILGRLLVLAGVAWMLWDWYRSGLAAGALTAVVIFCGIAVYLWAGAGEALRLARLIDDLERVDLPSLLHPVRTMHADAPLHRLPGTGAQEAGRLPAVIVVLDHEDIPLGYLDPDAVQEALADDALDSPAASCLRACPPEWVLDVEIDEVRAEDVVEAMNERQVVVLLLRGEQGPYAVAEAGLLGSAVRS